MNSIRIIVLLYLFSAIHAFAAIGNDKTLQVDFFGTSLLHIDENSDGIFEREDALLQYAQDNGITVLILRKLELAKIPGVKYILPSDSVYVNSRDTTLENHLGRFIHKARTQYGISKVCSSANPYWKTGTGSSSVYNQNNRHFGNINEFNRRQKALNDSTYCFNMVMVEHDFWLGSNPLTNIFKNWDTLYLPGLRYLYNIVKTTSNTPLYHSLTVATYIGNLKPVEAAVLATPDSISQQQQVDSIDKYTDWVYIDFYFRGDKIDQKNTAGIYQFFARDKSLGSRMLRFAQNSYPSYILPLYACQSSADVNSNFFGDYIVNKNGMYFSQDSTAWHGTLDDVKTIFESLYNDTIDPYGTGSTFTLKQLCENNATVPNNMSVGVAWFKYSTMPESGYMLKSADTTGSAVATTFTIRPDELIKTGSNGCSNCDSINASKNEVAGQIISRIWYLNGDSIANEHNDTLMANLLLGDTSIYTYEFTVYDPGNTGAFNKLKIRKDTKIVKPLIIGNDCGWGPHWNVNASTNSSCPSYSNGTVSLEYICSSCSNINMIYKWYDSNNNLLLTQNSATTTATGLSAGKYQVKFYCSSNNFVSECFVMVYAVDNSPHPTIYSDNDEINCYASMHINSAYSSYSIQWYRNGTGAGNAISGATGLSYTAIQNGTYYVKVTQSGGCSGFSAPLVINYSPNATISGSDITCEINKTYSVAENPNNATYDWTLPGGVSASADGYSTITISNWNSAASTGGTISCTITNVCGNSTTANFVVKGCCDVGTGDLNNATLSTTQTLSGSFHINGTLNISGSGTVVTMSSADVQLNKEAKINVGAGAKLIITGGSYLRTCGSDMWTGIELLASSAEVQLLSKSKIEDAIVAIDAPHNGKVVIDDATLNANYIGLKITGTGVANSSYIGSSAIFSCKNSSNVNANCLKSPHSSQRTLQGICLNGIGSISIGDASNSSNEISNCETGIYTSTSTVNVTKTDFEVCNIGINAQNDAALNVTSSNFDECVTGIDDRYNVDLNVSSCNFNTGTKGIYTSLGNTISIGIHDNNFTDFTAFAIQHISNHRVQYSIYNNIISNTGSEGMNYPGGIEINGLYDNSIDNNSVTDIYLNEFYNLAKGIHLQSIDYAHIFNNLHNELMETGSYDYQTYGIKVENCSSTRIEVNSVSSYGSSQQQIWWSNGIMADNSPYTNLFCNSVGNIGRGLWIGGASPHTTLAGNAMGDCYDQVYLNWNLMGLQDQGASTTTNPPNGLALDNEWIGSPYTAGNGHQTTSYFSNYFKGGGYTTFHTRSGGSYEPTDNYTHDPTNDYQACATNILTNFSADPYCIERPELPNNSEYESRVAQDSIDYDSYFETFKWMGKEYLLSRSKQDANLVANDAAIANAVAQLEQENVGTIGALKDSLINVEVDSATIAVISPLQQINNGLQPTLAVESNYKTATNISLSFAQNKTFTNSQKSTVIYLSNLCPYSAGPAVYMARTLRALFEEIPPRYNSCDNYNPIPQNRKANLNQDGGFVSSYKLFPSPSDGNAVYEFSIDKKASANLKVYDYTGKLILQQDVSGTNRYEFKKLSLSEGVYHVQLFVNGDLGDEQNMVVVK